MRNLSLVELLSHHDVVPHISLQHPCGSVDADSQGVIYCSTENGFVVINFTNGQVVRSVDLQKEGYLPENHYITNIHYRIDDGSVCLALSNGDILNSSQLGEVECIGAIGEGIRSMSWSPDGEMLVVFSGGCDAEESRIYLFVCHGTDLEPLADFVFTQTDFGAAEPVTVGWGKKETQFHGSLGKQAAARSSAEAVASGLAAWDDSEPRIRWIGDGQFFAVSAIDRVLGSRKIRVWTREGQLHSTSEELTGLEQALDWRPSGNWIVSSQTWKNKHEIILFERNGLRRGEFTLPFPINTVKVREVMWNCESTILAVWLEKIDGETAYLQLWTTCNYHWYLKQSFEFGHQERPVVVTWDSVDGGKVYVVLANGTVARYTISWVTIRNALVASAQEVAVIDGCHVLVTPFRYVMVPPPMCAFALELSCPAHHIAFSPYSNQMAIWLNSGDVHIYNLDPDNGHIGTSVKVKAAGGDGFKVMCPLPGQHSSFSRVDLPGAHPRDITHLMWLSSTELVYVQPGDRTADGASYYLITAKLDTSSNQLAIRYKAQVESVLAAVSSGGHIILEYINGSVWKYSDHELKPYLCPSGKQLVFPLPCQQIDVALFNNQEAVIGLSQRYRLFVNEFELASNCTSFVIHREFLLLTTHSHTLRCVNLITPLTKLPGLADGKAHIFDETVRRIERGSRIVTCDVDDTSVILQMPRGNLEIIHPRALVLSTVRKLIDRLCYKQAFMLMYRHRINMNLLCDHNEAAFLKTIGLFVQQIDDVNLLNQFITDLSEEDVCQSMYTAFYKALSQSERTGRKRCKVDTVCDKIIQVMETMNPDRYLLCIMTALVRKTIPDLETALTKIKTLPDKRRGDDALKYLLFLVDVNKMYDVALGMYDFELVLMVAEKSQKDPKEYLPFLNDVRKLEMNYQRYTIDHHLKRFEKALVHISKCLPEHQIEFMALVEGQRLYLKALQLLSPMSQEHKDVTLALAAHLLKKKSYEEAGILFAQGGDHRSALNCFAEAACWQQAVVCMQQLALSKSEQLQMYKQLSDKLTERRLHKEAAVLLDEYAGQIEEAISVLIKGSQWNEALRLIVKYNRHDFIETDLKPCVASAYSQLSHTVQTTMTEIVKHKDRYMVVKRLDAEKAELIGDEYRDIDADVCSDTSSVTGDTSSARSTSSAVSRSTGRTARNQRKAQRKKWTLREGSKFEGLALLDEMKKLVCHVDSLRGEVRGLLLALTQFAYLDLALALQSAYSQALADIQALIKEVWPADISPTFGKLIGENSTVNSILINMSSGATADPTVEIDSAELEVKQAPTVSSDLSWRLKVLSPMSSE